jgi:hypothetical protein
LHGVENQVAAERLRAPQPADQQSEAGAVDRPERTAVEDHFRLTWHDVLDVLLQPGTLSACSDATDALHESDVSHPPRVEGECH